MKVDKTKFKDVMGRPLTQGLFLEIQYDTKFAYYTLTDEDKEYEGKIYPSLKRLYLEMEDPVEYEFANTYLLGWKHWMRMCGNAMLLSHIEEWRNELELKLASTGVRMMMDQAEDNMQAAKWLAERGWAKRGAGRPAKEEKEKDRNLQEYLNGEFGGDVIRMSDHK